ncbi:MAG: hypothetical protein NVS1B4_01680 [Gemmatimonadaceae bacterium]
MRCSTRGALFALSLPLARSGAQTMRTVEPGTVATVGVRLTARAAIPSGGARYQIDASDRVRLFVPREGVLSTDSSDVAVLPLTFTTAGDLPAGLTRVARVVVFWSDAVIDTTYVSAVIGTVHRLEVALRSDPPTVAEGGSTRVIYRIANRGNAPDTVHLSVDAGPDWRARWPQAPLVIALGAEVTGTIEVAPHERSRAGEVRTIVLWATGAGGARQASTVLHVIRDLGPVPGLAQIPATLFVGTGRTRMDAPNGGSAIIALDAGGEISPGTDMTLRVRHAPSLIPPAFQASVNGPAFQVGLHAPTWNAAAGEVFALGSALTGYALQGLGAHASTTTAGVVTDVLLAQPEPIGDIGQSHRSGHLARGSVGVRTTSGVWGATIFDALRPVRPGLPLAQVQSAALRFEPASFGESRVEAGIVKLESPLGPSATGPAVDAAYAGTVGQTGITARAKATPGLVPGGDGADRALAASAVSPLSRHLALDGVMSYQSGPRGADSGSRQSSDAGLGFRYFDLGRMYAVHAVLSRNSSLTQGGAPIDRRGVSATTSIPLGHATLDATLETGLRSQRDTTTWVSGYRTGVRWLGDLGWGWVGLAHTVNDAAASTTRADVAGSLNSARLSVDGGGGLSLSGGPASSNLLWAGITAQIVRGTAAVIGIEYQSHGVAAGWRTAIGIRRRLAMPLPLRPSPAVEGIVFEDVNGNGRRDAGEPGVGGVSVSLVGLTATTDARGRFSFLDAPPGSVVDVDVTTLPTGTLLTGSPLSDRGRGPDIAVVRGATISLRILAATPRQHTGPDAPPVAVAALVDAAGRIRETVADATGHIVFRDLVPGEYRITVHEGVDTDRRTRETTLSCIVKSGESVTRDVRVEFDAREIRGLDGTALDLPRSR